MPNQFESLYKSSFQRLNKMQCIFYCQENYGLGCLEGLFIIIFGEVIENTTTKENGSSEISAISTKLKGVSLYWMH